MFDPTPSLPLRAAIASLLGGLFGVALILATHNAQAQVHSATDSAQAVNAPSVMVLFDDGLKRLGDAALQALRGSEPVYGLSNAGARFARLNEGATARNRDALSLGAQVRF